MKRYSHTQFKKKLLQDPEVLAAYNDLAEEYRLINEMIRARNKAGKTQEEIAELMRTTKSAISKLESINDKNKHSPSFATLKKYAHALGYTISIRFIPKKD